MFTICSLFHTPNYPLSSVVIYVFKNVTLRFCLKIQANYGGSFRTYRSKICIFCFSKQKSMALFPQVKYICIYFPEQEKFFLFFESKIKCLTLFLKVKMFSVFVSVCKCFTLCKPKDTLIDM